MLFMLVGVIYIITII